MTFSKKKFEPIASQLEAVQDALVDIEGTDRSREEAIYALSCAALGLAHGGDIDIASCGDCPKWGTCHRLPDYRLWMVIEPTRVPVTHVVIAGGVEGAIKKAGYVMTDSWDITLIDSKKERAWHFVNRDVSLIIVRL